MIAVLGTGRCGTTTVARLLQTELGVDMGGPGTSCSAHPQGDWEEKTIREWNWQFIRGEIPGKAYLDNVANYKDAKAEPWGVKHPGFSLMMPLFMAAFGEADIIWCTRDMKDTVKSWQKLVDVPEYDLWVSVNFRHWAIEYALMSTRKRHLHIDMTERIGEDKLVQGMGEYLGMDGH